MRNMYDIMIPLEHNILNGSKYGLFEILNMD